MDSPTSARAFCCSACDPVFSYRRLAAFAPHQAIECGEIRTLPPLGEKRCRIHGRELFGHGRRYELIDADAIGFGAVLHLRLASAAT
jgi:hypothetical protein